MERTDRGGADSGDLVRAWRALAGDARDARDAVGGQATGPGRAVVDLGGLRGVVVVDRRPRRGASSGVPALAARLGVEVRELEPVVAGALAAAARPGLAGPSDRVALLDVGPELTAAVVAQGRVVIGGADPGTGRRPPARPDGGAPGPRAGSAPCGRRRAVVAVDDGVAVTLERLLGRAAHAGAVLTSCFDLDTLVLGGLAADLDSGGRAALEGAVRRAVHGTGPVLTSPAGGQLRVAFLAVDDELVMHGALGHALSSLRTR